MIIFEGNSTEYEVEMIDQCNNIVRVKNKESKMIFEGVASTVEIGRERPFFSGSLMATNLVYDVKVEMIKLLRVKS